MRVENDLKKRSCEFCELYFGERSENNLSRGELYAKLQASKEDICDDCRKPEVGFCLIYKGVMHIVPPTERIWKEWE